MSHFILDCDPGHDDAVAILVAAKFLDLIGVTTVFGNSTVENTTRNAIAILDAAGRSDIPVAMGAPRPLTGDLHSGETVHGKLGLDGAHLPASSRQPHSLDAADFIARKAEKYDDLVVIAIAPETNVATAITRHPHIKSRIREISVMGGSTTGGNATAAAEFNIFADPEAADIVFSAGIPVTMVGLNVTTRFGITTRDLEVLRKIDSVIAREIGGALNYYLDRQTTIYEGRDFAPVHDICAVVPYSHPGLITHLPMHVAIECQGEHTRGMTVCDQRGVVSGDGIALTRHANARVATSCDGPAITRVLLDTLGDFP